MKNSKITSKSNLSPLILLLLLPFLTFTTSLSLSPSPSQKKDTDDLEDLEQLIAIDDEHEDLEKNSQPTTHCEIGKKFVAEILSKIVIELNNDSTKRVIEGNKYVMIFGYAPWCDKSAEIMPRFAQVANVLKGLGSDVLMAKLDSWRFLEAAASLGIDGYPALLLFVNGSSQIYTGGFSSVEMVTWARKKTGFPVVRVNSVTEANEFLNQYAIFAIGLFDKFEGPNYEEFRKSAIADDEIQFMETSSLDIAKLVYPITTLTIPFFGRVKGEPEHFTCLDGNLKADVILRFLEDNKFPLVTILSEENLDKVYSSHIKLQVYVFAEEDDLKKLLKPLRDIAKKFKSKIMFVGVDIREDHLTMPLLTLCGLEEFEKTTVTAFDYTSNSKYLLEGGPTSRNIEDFCTGLLQGTISPHYKSQPIPDNKNASILTVVGKTFDDLIVNGPTNVLLEVHRPWCITCEATSKRIEKLAKHFKGLDSLVFARIDASANEHPKLQVEDYQTLLFYPSNDKSNPIKLRTKSRLKNLAALINEKLKSQDPLSKDEL